MKYITIDNDGYIIGKSTIETIGSIEVDDNFNCINMIYDGNNFIDYIQGLKSSKKTEARGYYKKEKIKELYDSAYKKIEKDIDECTTKEEIDNIIIE